MKRLPNALRSEITPSLPSLKSNSTFWLTQYPWKDKNNNNKRTLFIEHFDSCTSLQSSDLCSLDLPGSDSSNISHHVIPPSSPAETQGDNPAGQHQCHNPFECADRARRTRSLLNQTHVLSYLPPFRLCEEVSPTELQARRLFKYFHQYPCEAPPSAIMPLDPATTTTTSTSNDEVPYVGQHLNALSQARHRKPCTRSHSLSSDYPHLIDSKVMRLRSNFFRSCSFTRLPVTWPPKIWATISHVPSAMNLKTHQQNADLVAPDSPSASVIALTDCDDNVEFPQDSLPSSCILESSTDWSICLPCASSADSSTASRDTLPYRVSVCQAPPSPYVDEGDECAHNRSILVNRDTHPANRSPRCYPTAPFVLESQSSDLVLPDPPSDDFRSVACTDSVNWPPTPLDLLLTSPSPVPLISPSLRPMTRTQLLTVSHHVVNILILPTCGSCPSISPTLVSPPTEVVLADSVCDKLLEKCSTNGDQTSFSSHMAHAHPHPAQLRLFQSDASEQIDGLGDRFMPVDSPIHRTLTSSTLQSNEITYRLQSRSASRASKQTTPMAKSRGDCMLDTEVASPYSMTADSQTYSRKTPPQVPFLPHPLFRTTSMSRARSRRRSPTIRPLRTPCLSAIYASIRSRPLSTTRRRVRGRHSASLECIAMQRTRQLASLTRSRPELNTTVSTEQTVSRVFAIPDVSGLQKSVSCFGSPISPSLVPSLHNPHNGISGTHGRPTDRRLYSMLQRYPGSSAEMLQEVQRAHGQRYAFLVLHTPTWSNMFSLVRGLDRLYPHWQLARQLSNTRGVMARATDRACWRSVPGLNQAQPILSPSNH